MRGVIPNNRNKLLSIIATAGIFVAWSSVAAAQQTAAPVNAAVVAAQCVLCHGPDGKGSGDVPRIDNMSVDGMKNQLMAFRNAAKANTIMTRFSKGLTEAQVDAVAKFYGKN